MTRPSIRLVALLALGAQLTPVALPLFCPQASRDTPASCDADMANGPHAVAIDVAAAPSACADSAFCPTHMTAVLALHNPDLSSTLESALDAVSMAECIPADPQPPPPPPPQA